MASPSDLIAHYSTRAFLTRLAALTFAGAVIGATLNQLDDREISTVVGFTLIIIVLSLAELNRRYTHSYLAACQAASTDLGDNSAEAVRWRTFKDLNEKQWRNPVRRFLLSWLTYLPGLLLGEYLVLRWGLDVPGAIALVLGVVILGVWALASNEVGSPRDSDTRRGDLMNTAEPGRSSGRKPQKARFRRSSA